MDLGADRRGVDMGPSAIRYAGLAAAVEETDRECTDGGDLVVPQPETMTSKARHVGVVWFDAHGDFNTPRTSPSGNVHGMSLAALLGLGEFADADERHVLRVDARVRPVGVRDLDSEERVALRESPVTVYTMSDVDDRGLPEVAEEALAIADDGTDGVHVSLDMDFLDPNEAPGVGTPVRGGVTYREAHAAMERVADLGDDIRTMEVVEVNPILDSHNGTAELAVELVASALGKRILR